MERIGVDHFRDEPIFLKEAILPGALSGLFGAVSMGAVLMLFGLREGDLWKPLKLIGAAILKEGAVGPGFQPFPAAVGIAIHLITAILFGIFFVWIGGYLNVGPAVGWGATFGLAVWVIMQFGLLPVVNLPLAGISPISFALAHLVFGLTLGLYPYFLRRETALPQIHRKAA